MSQTKWERILSSFTLMSKKQQLLCRYVQDNPQDVGLLTARQLAAQAGVGEATVFRFLKESGYDSYGEFRSDVHKYAIEHAQSSYWQMKASLTEQEQENNIFYQQILETIDLLQRTINQSLYQHVQQAASLMLSCPQVGILGLRSSKAPALYLHALLMPFLGSVRQFSYDEHFVFEQIKSMPKDSALFIVSSWPNTKTVVRAAEFAHTLGHKIILLTNSTSCPMVSCAQITLLAPECHNRYTIAPYITIIEALAQEIGRRGAPESLKKLEDMDAILAQEDVTNWTNEMEIPHLLSYSDYNEKKTDRA